MWEQRNKLLGEYRKKVHEEIMAPSAHPPLPFLLPPKERHLACMVHTMELGDFRKKEKI